MPGCVTQGESFEEAQALVKDAIVGYVSVLNDDNEEIPTEKKGVTISEVYAEIALKGQYATNKNSQCQVNCYQ